MLLYRNNSIYGQIWILKFRLFRFYFSSNVDVVCFNNISVVWDSFLYDLKSCAYYVLWVCRRLSIDVAVVIVLLFDLQLTTYAISAYHHWSCELESHPGRVYLVQYCVIKFVSDSQFPPPINLSSTIQLKYCWNKPTITTATSMDRRRQTHNT
jgi:hypothetical protein